MASWYLFTLGIGDKGEEGVCKKGLAGVQMTPLVLNTVSQMGAGGMHNTDTTGSGCDIKEECMWTPGINHLGDQSVSEFFYYIFFD